MGGERGILYLHYPFALSEVETLIALDAALMGVSTSLDTNGNGLGSGQSCAALACRAARNKPRCVP